jgi:hypothetical protein
MLSDLLEARKKYLHARLLNITYAHYLKCKEEHKDVPKYKDII